MITSTSRFARALRLLAVCVALVATTPHYAVPVVDVIVLVASTRGERDATPRGVLPPAPSTQRPVPYASSVIDAEPRIVEAPQRAHKSPLFLMHRALLC